MDNQDGRNEANGEGRANTPNANANRLDSPAEQRPHQGRRRANGGAAAKPRPGEDPCPSASQIDPGTKHMVDILVDMAIRKILARAGAKKVAEER